MNKKELVLCIKQYIIEQAKHFQSIPYRDIKDFALTHDDLRDYLDRRVDSLNYLDNIIKCDKQFINGINDNEHYFFKRNRKGSLVVTDLDIVIFPENATDAYTDIKISSRQKKKTSREIIEELNLEGFERYSCVYNRSIQEVTGSKRNKLKISLTNEPVFCTYLQSLRFIEEFDEDYFENNLLEIIYCKDSIKVLHKLDKSVVCNVSMGNSLMLVNITDQVYKNFVNRLSKVYPFTHFRLLESVMALYLIFRCGNVESNSFLKYLTFLIVDIIKSTMVNKYFSSRNNKIFNTFYDDKIEELVNSEKELVISFCKNINTLKEDKLISFIAAYYKLFIYIKNKLNREVKKFAFDYYQNRVNNTFFLDVTECQPIHI
jgi:hypothetical protein